MCTKRARKRPHNDRRAHDEHLQDYFYPRKRKTNGTLISCFLYVSSHYFERRECISFNADGWIGFAGWADQGNTNPNPILRAFIEWCDALAATKEKEDTQQ